MSLSVHFIQQLRRRQWAVYLFLSVLLVGGCRSIPDLKPFTEATAEIDLAANKTHDFVVLDLTKLASQAPNHASAERKAIEGARDDFSKEWKIRLEATAALVEYSASLASIADAGMTGSDGAKALGDSVNQLLGSIPSVTAQIPAATINIAAWVKGEVDMVKAADSLAAAVRQADPVIKNVSSILANDFGIVANKIDINVIAAQTLINYQFGSVPSYREALIKRQDAIATKIANVNAGNAIPNTYVTEMKLVAGLIEKIEPEYIAYCSAYDGAANRGTAQKAIAIKARDAVIVWARLHGDLDESLSEERAPSVAILTNKALELKDLVDELRGEKS